MVQLREKQVKFGDTTEMETKEMVVIETRDENGSRGESSVAN